MPIGVGHTAIGVIIGSTIANHRQSTECADLEIDLIRSFGLGVATHYLFDFVPHGHYNVHLNRPTVRHQLLMTTDLVLPWVIVAGVTRRRYGFFAPRSLLIAAGVAGAHTPDILNGLRNHHRLPFPHWSWLRIEDRFHQLTHRWHPRQPSRLTDDGNRLFSRADIWQITLVIIAAWLLIRQRSGIQ